MVVYRCQDSIESIFTAIYLTYEEKRDRNNTCILLDDEPVLFAENVEVIPDVEKALKVMTTLKKRFGERDYVFLCFALSSGNPGKAQCVYRTVLKGLDSRCREGHLFDSLADDFVLTAFKLARNAEREEQHLRGFMRFQELESGMLYAKYGSKNNLLTFLMPHFADRLPIENFVIHDADRGIFGVHPAGREWYLVSGKDLEEPELVYSEGEREFSRLFRHFCKSIAIEARENPALQRNMLPLRFREYMMEFL